MKYSIRMRAAETCCHEDGGAHISGAEKIVSFADISQHCKELTERALGHEKGIPDFINLNVESIQEEDILYVPSLPVLTINTETYADGEKIARLVMKEAGISEEAINHAWEILMKGDGERNSYPGALVLDGKDAELLNPECGCVRATRMDYTRESECVIDGVLDANGLTRTRLKDALVLATKVVAAPGTVCELCFSDNPDYHIGYVAVRGVAFFRIPFLKPPEAVGGRVFLVDRNQLDWENYQEFLTKKPVLIDRITPFHHDLNVKDGLQFISKLLKGSIQ